MPFLPSPTRGLPPTAIRQMAAAAAALDAGRLDQAQGFLHDVLTSHPDHPEVLRLKAGVQGLRGQYALAVETMRRAIAHRPDDPVYLNTLATMLGSAGELDAAIDVLRHACALQPGLATAWFNLGVFLTRCVRHSEAVEALKRAVQIEPANAYARCLMGDMLRVEGNVEQAGGTYRAVLAQWPWFGMAWWGLADLRSDAFSPGDAAAMRAAFVDPRATLDDRIATGFALAHALDSMGDYENAFAILQQAHKLARKRQAWDGQAFSAHLDGILASSPPPLKEGRDSPFGHEAIFVVGLPRSGTTLVEQILASHSMVHGSGELPDLPLVLNEESHRRGLPFPEWSATATAADWRRLGERYLARTQRWRTQKSRFVDKLPINWMNIGVILAMLPGAHVVLCRRDPVETCFSCYRQLMQNNEYTRTFDDLAAYWRAFDRAGHHWQALYPDRVFELVHEALLMDPTHEIRRLLNHCGLPFDANCLDFHATHRNVHSPSASQVRQPLRKDTRHAPPYGALLDPLRKALAMPVAQTPQ